MTPKTATPHQLEVPTPGIGEVDLKSDAVDEMVGILRAHPLVDDPHDIAIGRQAAARRIVSGADDLHVGQRETVQAGAGYRRTDGLNGMRKAGR